MNRAGRILQRRKNAKEQLAAIMGQAERVIVIHYSCQSFYARPDGASPRVTSIAVRNLASAQTETFSIHQVGERTAVPLEKVAERYDDLEKAMLSDYYHYVQAHASFKWLHWNMRDSNYGFQAIAHRYKVLGGQRVDIPEGDRIDLSRLLVATYGLGYIGHPRLTKLIARNNISDLAMLGGEEEAATFNRGEYVKLHQSTLRKVDALANIVERANDGILKTDTNWARVYGLYPEALGEFLRDHPWVIIFSFLVNVASLAGLVIGWLRHP